MGQEQLLKASSAAAKELTADRPHGRRLGCTGFFATWCPIHGDCRCREVEEHEDGFLTGYTVRESHGCALHEV